MSTQLTEKEINYLTVDSISNHIAALKHEVMCGHDIAYNQAIDDALSVVKDMKRNIDYIYGDGCAVSFEVKED